MTLPFSPPEPIRGEHNLSPFDCGVSTLNRWLANLAMANQVRGASRTFVIHQDRRVTGYYCLVAGGVERQELPGTMRQNMPNPIPAIILGRLAVDARWQGQGLGAVLLKDAMARAQFIASHVGAAILVVDTNDQGTARFYKKFGFRPFPHDASRLLLKIRAPSP